MPKKQNFSGFTLIELMVAIAIIAVMATIGMVIYSTAQKAGRVSKRVQDLEALRTAIELYKTANGSYPSQSAAATCANSLTALTTALVPNYMSQVPADPSGGSNCYKYQSDATVTPIDYKIWTSNSEMTANEYNTQTRLIDPARDGDGDATIVTCTINAIPAGTTATSAYAWAYYTNSAAACAY